MARDQHRSQLLALKAPVMDLIDRYLAAVGALLFVPDTLRTALHTD